MKKETIKINQNSSLFKALSNHFKEISQKGEYNRGAILLMQPWQNGNLDICLLNNNETKKFREWFNDFKKGDIF